MRTREIITTTIDPDLKQLFENTKIIHNLTFSQLMDKAIRDILISLNQVPIIDQEISRKDIEINKIRQEQETLQSLKQQLNNLTLKLVEIKNNGNDLEEKRNKTLSHLLKTPLKEWTGMNKNFAVRAGKFKDKNEMENWVLSQQKEMVL